MRQRAGVGRLVGVPAARALIWSETSLNCTSRRARPSGPGGIRKDEVKGPLWESGGSPDPARSSSGMGICDQGHRAGATAGISGGPADLTKCRDDPPPSWPRGEWPARSFPLGGLGREQGASAVGRRPNAPSGATVPGFIAERASRVPLPHAAIPVSFAGRRRLIISAPPPTATAMMGRAAATGTSGVPLPGPKEIVCVPVVAPLLESPE